MLEPEEDPLPADQLLQADVALVFGMNAPLRPAAHAIDLWQRGFARRLLFTGGFNTRLGAIEAEVMADAARQAGVPDDAILIEPLAGNTDQNAEFSARLLAQEAAAEDRLRLLIVTVHFHLRRALLAVRRWHGPDVTLGWSSYASRHYSAENWQASARARRDVATETAKIRLYYACGYALPSRTSR